MTDISYGFPPRLDSDHRIHAPCHETIRELSRDLVSVQLQFERLKSQLLLLLPMLDPLIMSPTSRLTYNDLLIQLTKSR